MIPLSNAVMDGDLSYKWAMRVIILYVRTESTRSKDLHVMLDAAQDYPHYQRLCQIDNNNGYGVLAMADYLQQSNPTI